MYHDAYMPMTLCNSIQICTCSCNKRNTSSFRHLDGLEDCVTDDISDCSISRQNVVENIINALLTLGQCPVNDLLPDIEVSIKVSS